MRPLLRTLLGAATLVLASLTAAAQTATNAQSGMTEFKGVEALRTQFNADTGKPRLLLLLSPT